MATSNKKHLTFFRCTGVVLAFILIFAGLNRLLQPKYANTLVEGSMIYQYYQEAKDHEIIIIGDCEVYANFSPMVMYQRQGLKVYVRGSSQQMIWQSYWLLKETLKYEKPKIVVFSVNAVRYDKTSDKVKEEYNRLTIDQMRWSAEKIAIIKESMTEQETFLSYVLPILRYHSRYDKITNEDFQYFFKGKANTFNGFLVNKEIKALENLPTVKRLPTYQFSDESLKYLDLIYDLCRQNDIDLVLIKAPSLYPHWYPEYDQQIIDYSVARGVNYYNFLSVAQEIGIDYNLDTYDGGLHMNLTGATKLSQYFADRLVQDYQLTDYRGDPLYDKKLQAYQEFINN